MWFFKKKKKKVTPPSYARGISNNQPVVVDDMVTSALNPLNPLSPFWIGATSPAEPSKEDNLSEEPPPTAEAEPSSSWSHSQDSGSSYSDSSYSSCDSGSSDGGGSSCGSD